MIIKKKPVELHPSSYFILHETYSLIKFSVFIKQSFGSGISVKHVYFLNSKLFMILITSNKE